MSIRPPGCNGSVAGTKQAVDPFAHVPIRAFLKVAGTLEEGGGSSGQADAWEAPSLIDLNHPMKFAGA